MKDDVPFGCLGVIHTWIQIHCTKGSVATEVGSKAHQLHVQGVIECFFPGSTLAQKSMNKTFKSLFPPGKYRI